MFSLPESPIFYAAAVPAVILVGLSKGGFAGLATLSLPLLALVSAPIRAAAIMLPILIVQDMVSVWFYRHDFDRRVVAILLAGSLIGIAGGALFAAHVSNAAVLLIVGLIASGFVLYSWLRKGSRDKAPQPANVAPGLFWGACLGTPDELLIGGDLAAVRDEIVTTGAEAAQRKGWMFDTYLLRRR